VIVLRRWALKKFPPRRGHPRRIHMSSASSARSAANAWITSSSSTRATCGASSRGIFNIITGAGHISHSTRIIRSLATYSLLQARLSRSQRSAVYIIAMNVARHDRRARFGVKDRGIFRPLCSHATEPRISIHFAPRRRCPRYTDRPRNTYSTIGRLPRSAAADSNTKYIFEQRQAFVARLRPGQLPDRATRQLPDLSTIIRVESSSTDDSRLRGALPNPGSQSVRLRTSNQGHLRPRR
jgi:hypothetical protein